MQHTDCVHVFYTQKREEDEMFMKLFAFTTMVVALLTTNAIAVPWDYWEYQSTWAEAYVKGDVGVHHDGDHQRDPDTAPDVVEWEDPFSDTTLVLNPWAYKANMYGAAYSKCNFNMHRDNPDTSQDSHMNMSSTGYVHSACYSTTGTTSSGTHEGRSEQSAYIIPHTTAWEIYQTYATLSFASTQTKKTGNTYGGFAHVTVSWGEELHWSTLTAVFNQTSNRWSVTGTRWYIVEGLYFDEEVSWTADEEHEGWLGLNDFEGVVVWRKKKLTNR